MRRFVLPLCAALAFASCSAWGGKLRLVEGTFWESRGMYDEALGAYQAALDYQQLLPYAHYALGSVYLLMEDTEAALEHFEAAAEAAQSADSRDAELTYRLRYNRGVALFLQSEYQDAFAAFKSALEADGGRLEAKRNLELCLLSLRRQQEGVVRQNSPQTQSGESAAGSGILFDFIRRKESQQWKSWEWSGSQSGGPDY